MSWYELLLTLHIVAAGLYLGSGIAIWVLSQRLLAVDPAAFGTFAKQAGWWASKAHPGASVVLILAGFAMIADADIDFDTWVILGLIGWFVLGAIGGGGVGNAGKALEAAIERQDGDAVIASANRLLLFSRLETAVLILVIVDMVDKPGLG
jgi:hypothetical protein